MRKVTALLLIGHVNTRSTPRGQAREFWKQASSKKALCHLANISYRLGKNSAADAIKEAVMLDANTKDSFQRFTDHLAANQVNVPSAPAVLGAALSLAPGKEMFVSKEKYDLGVLGERAGERRIPQAVRGAGERVAGGALNAAGRASPAAP